MFLAILAKNILKIPEKAAWSVTPAAWSGFLSFNNDFFVVKLKDRG